VGAILRERGSFIKLGAQDLYHEPDGAYTGEVSIAMLRDCGVGVVLAGHSERRHVVGERESLVNAKATASLAAGLECILCVGETLQEREANRTDAVNERQVRSGLAGIPPEHLERLTIAYEPVWAIGTGRNATPADAQDAQARIRAVVAQLHGDEHAWRVRIQYGGSVNPGNAAALFAGEDVDGGLVGGASLKAPDFVAIVRAAAAAKQAG
jgi:triosephosphate isomerase